MADELKKETIRFFADDVDLIRQFYPAGYGKPGINEVIRTVIRSWVDQNLRGKEIEGAPDDDTINISESILDGRTSQS